MLNRSINKLFRLLNKIICSYRNLSSDNASDAAVRAYAHENWNSDVVKMINTEKNEGLIRAKIFGAQHATGEVLVFLDSHCEVNERWLEPLLDRIVADRHTLVSGFI